MHLQPPESGQRRPASYTHVQNYICCGSSVMHTTNKEIQIYCIFNDRRKQMTNVFEVKDDRGDRYCFRNDLLIFNDLNMNEDALIQVEVRENAPVNVQQINSPSEGAYEEFEPRDSANDEEMHCLNSLPSTNSKQSENVDAFNMGNPEGAGEGGREDYSNLKHFLKQIRGKNQMLLSKESYTSQQNLESKTQEQQETVQSQSK
jgi:hypothetical protein